MMFRSRRDQVTSGLNTRQVQRRLLLLATLGIVLTGTVVMLSTVLPLYHQEQQERRSMLLQDLQIRSLAFVQLFNRYRDSLNRVSADRRFVALVRAYAGGQVDETAFRRRATPLLSTLPIPHDVLRVGFVDGSGHDLLNDTPMPGDLTAGIHGPLELTGRTAILAVAPITDGIGMPLGQLTLEFDPATLYTLYGQLRHSNHGGRLLLVNQRDGLVLSEHDGAPALRPLDEQPALLETLLAGQATNRFYQPVGAASPMALSPVDTGWQLVFVLGPGGRQDVLREVGIPALLIVLMIIGGTLVTHLLMRPLAGRLEAQNARLRDTADEQQALLEYAGGFLYRCTSEGVLHGVSPSVERVLGYTPDELPSRYEDLLTDAPINKGVEEQRRQALQGASEGYTVEVRHRDGKRVLLEMNGRPYQHGGETVGVIGVARDVTDRVRAQEALLDSERNLRTLINAGPDIICFKDGNGRWLESNEANLRAFGLQRCDYRGRNDQELSAAAGPLFRDALLTAEQSDQQTWEHGGPSRFEETIAEPGGGERVYDVIKVPLFGAAGERQGLVVLGRDVTDQKRAQRALEDSAAEWNHAMDFFDDAVLLMDREQRVVRANQAFHALFNVTPGEAVGRRPSDFLSLRVGDNPWQPMAVPTPRQERFRTLEADHPANPTQRPVEVMSTTIRDGSGRPSGTLLAVRDLTRSRQTESELRLAASVFEGSHEAVLITDPQLRIQRVNHAFTVITGYHAHRAVGSLLQELLRSERHDELFYDQIWVAINQRGRWQGEVWSRHADGTEFPVWQSISAVRDAHGEVLRYISIFTDITDKKQSEERIHHLAHYDVLTELPNRTLFQDRLEQAIERARRRHAMMGLLFLDLDRFKQVNDTLGHQAGDRLLQVLAERLRRCVREEDTVARLGGDEFTLILEEMGDPEGAAIVAEKIRDRICEPVDLEGHAVQVGTSIGIAVYPEDGEDGETLLKNADTAMYRAKERGRNNFQFYAASLSQRNFERRNVEMGLREALQHSQLELHYQPQLNLRDGQFDGVEALLRWNHPEQGMVMPAAFIRLAEETGLIKEIGHWVLATACHQAAQWQALAGTELRVAVNLSSQQVSDGELVKRISQVLEETGLAPRLLELEISERLLQGQDPKRIQILKDLKALGVSIAVDDFGTGCSSLTCLREMPVDRLKIDNAFVRQINEGKGDIADTIISMAHHLELRVMAEGVETEDQLYFLRQHQCDETQGFLIGRPLTAAACEALLREPQIRH